MTGWLWAMLASVVFCAAPATLFPVMYHLTARWWETPYGRNVMGLAASLALAVDLTLLFWLWQPPLWLGASLQVAVFGFIGCVMCRRISLLVQAQRRKGDEDG